MFNKDEDLLLKAFKENDRCTRSFSKVMQREADFSFGAPAGLFDREVQTDVAHLSGVRKQIIEAQMREEKESIVEKTRADNEKWLAEKGLSMPERAAEPEEQLEATDRVIEEVPDETPVETWEMVNWWVSNSSRNGKKYQVTVLKCKETGKYRHEIDRQRSYSDFKMDLLVGSLDVVSRFCPLNAERKARKQLLSMLRPVQEHDYFLTGAFSESKTRSGLTYLLRSGRPTLAYRQTGSKPQRFNFVAGLCTHSVGYYTDTYAGFTCPSDELISHLLMIRSDEYNFWKRSNHHDRHSAGAGI
jgi:hypothetical protein